MSQSDKPLGSGGLDEEACNVLAFECADRKGQSKIDEVIEYEGGPQIEVKEVGIDRFTELSEKNDNQTGETKND